MPDTLPQTAGKTCGFLAALPALAEHEMHIFLQVTPPTGNWDELPVTMSGLLGSAGLEAKTSAWIPGDVQQSLLERYGAQPVWERTELQGGGDLHPHLRALVNGKMQSGGENLKLVQIWTATQQVLRLLDKADNYSESTPREERSQRCLAWIPSKSATKRLAAGGVAEPNLAYRIITESLHVYAFRTELLFAHACVRIAPFLPGAGKPLARSVLPVEMLEANVALVRLGSLTWVEPAESLPDKPIKFTFGSVLRNLTGVMAAEEKGVDRTFAYNFVQFNDYVRSSDADRFGLHLARHYTSEYALSEAPGGVVYVSDFTNVRHVMALEGAATIIAPEADGIELPEFLKNFATGTLRKHYVPIALLARHEHAFLVEQTTESNFWPILRDSHGEEAIAEEDIAKLRKLREASLEFRLAFRFSQISLVTMHNEVNQAFRQAMGLDRMLAELSADVGEASVYLSEVQRQSIADKQEQTRAEFVRYATLGTAILAGVAVFNDVELFTANVLNSQLSAGCWSLAFTLLTVVVAYEFLYRQAIRETAHLHKSKRGENKRAQPADTKARNHATKSEMFE
jgi:hypothetical protein